MLDRHDPETVAVMGDSAGGGMALALCHAVRDAGLPPPTDAVLLCPWLHVALPHPDVAGLARSDVTFNVDDLRAAGLPGQRKLSTSSPQASRIRWSGSSTTRSWWSISKVVRSSVR
jgi:acetyl esterase/lipase